jgi:adenosylcobinamide-phosphate synthase
VRLGGEVLKPVFAPGAQDTALDQGTESIPGREPELAHLRSVVGLVWRSVVMWLVLLALLTLARLLG